METSFSSRISPSISLPDAEVTRRSTTDLGYMYGFVRLIRADKEKLQPLGMLPFLSEKHRYAETVCPFSMGQIVLFF